MFEMVPYAHYMVICFCLCLQFIRETSSTFQTTVPNHRCMPILGHLLLFLLLFPAVKKPYYLMLR